jgi:hypothetical protein
MLQRAIEMLAKLIGYGEQVSGFATALNKNWPSIGEMCGAQSVEREVSAPPLQLSGSEPRSPHVSGYT